MLANGPSDTLVADGHYGPFEGFAQDEVVFGHYRAHGSWSPELQTLLARLFPDGRGSFLDVGANIGLVSIPLAQRLPGLVVHAFEPAPGNFALLARNLARHGLTERVGVHALAAHSAPAELTMALSPNNSGDHHVLADAAGEGALTVGVAAAPLDSLLDSLLASQVLPEPVVMKVDTQGSEVHVLRGAKKLLARVEHLILEYWPLGLSRQGHRPADLRAPLSVFSRGALLDQSGQMPVQEPLTALLDRLAFFSDDDPGFFDLWCSRDGSEGD